MHLTIGDGSKMLLQRSRVRVHILVRFSAPTPPWQEWAIEIILYDASPAVYISTGGSGENQNLSYDSTGEIFNVGTKDYPIVIERLNRTIAD